ncbi:MAG: hypothetical protein N2691_05855 [Patescibacteria group bacterium]|nr:hypothetical protein [Patescibacteria group bacterium]
MQADMRRYQFRPFVVAATTAHAEGLVVYDNDGVATVRYCDAMTGGPRTATVPLTGQFPLILPSLQDLNKALSQTANSPKTSDGRSLRERFDAEMTAYEEMLEQAMTAAGEDRPYSEPDYGTYVYDTVFNQLFLILPEFWHRLGLVTNNGNLCTDPDGKRSWEEVRAVFDGATVGIVGASVGGNLAEGIMREVRPSRIKIADYPGLELHIITNRLHLTAIAKIQEIADRTVIERDTFATELGDWLLPNSDDRRTNGMRGREFGFPDDFSSVCTKGSSASCGYFQTRSHSLQRGVR